MKFFKKFTIIAVFFLFSMFFVSCDKEPVTHTVTFMVNDTIYETVVVNHGEEIKKPTNPELFNFNFEGWYIEDEKWSFYSNEVKKDITLIANFDYGYKINKNTITEINEYGKTLNEIYILDGITNISENAFKDVKSLKSIVISKTVKDIGNSAFEGCSNLKSLIFEEDSELTNIGSNAFQFCVRLTNIEIPKNVENIGSMAFNYCYCLVEVKNLSNLDIVTGSKSFGEIGAHALRVYNKGESYLTTDSSGFIKYSDEDNVYLITYIGNQNELTIPNDITIINDYAFRDLNSLLSVIIPKNVTKIGEYAFQNCSKLTNLQFESDSNLKDIGEFAFFYCSSLLDIVIPNKVTTIGNYSFYMCTKINSLIIPDSVTYIGVAAFSGCNFKQLFFENIDNWSLSSEDMSKKIVLKSSDFSDMSVLIRYLTLIYTSYNWQRG